MNKKRPIGIIILAILFTLAALGYIRASYLGFKLGWEISTIHRILGILIMFCWVANIYFLLKPNEFGWKFIMMFLGITIFQNTIGLVELIFAGPGVDNIVRTSISFLKVPFMMFYVHQKKSYFMGDTKSI